MDILRKELTEFYTSQCLAAEKLPFGAIEDCCGLAEAFVVMSGGCAVVTDAASDTCSVYSGPLGRLLGISDEDRMHFSIASSDEDAIYDRLHPEDLVEKRMLEYEFFKHVDLLTPSEKTGYIASCLIRMLGRSGRYIAVDNTTQVIRTSPAGKVWLILCTYRISPFEADGSDILPRITDIRSGRITTLPLASRRSSVLSNREKQILRLIGEGMPSKQIASRLGISVNTVSRHRQNILARLSVGNSIEAYAAATAMKLL